MKKNVLGILLPIPSTCHKKQWLNFVLGTQIFVVWFSSRKYEHVVILNLLPYLVRVRLWTKHMWSKIQNHFGVWLFSTSHVAFPLTCISNSSFFQQNGKANKLVSGMKFAFWSIFENWLRILFWHIPFPAHHILVCLLHGQNKTISTYIPNYQEQWRKAKST